MANHAHHLHNVFFTLTDSSTDMVRQLVEDCNTYLKAQDGIEYFAAGARAEDCRREVNDQEFHVALTVQFRDRTAHDAYQTSDLHNQFVARNKGNWANARVFDSDVIV